MRKREWVFVTIMAFILLAMTVTVIAAKAYSDGYKAGCADTEQRMMREYNAAYQMQETQLGAMVDEANDRAERAEQALQETVQPVKVDKLPEQRKFGNSEQLKEQEHSASEWWSEDDVFCLAAVIYQEAGGDACSDETRRMVADVVLNRVFDNRFPNTIREVLEDAPGGALQYGRFALTGVCFPAAADAECEQHAVERAFRIANEVLDGEHSELFENGYIWQAEFAQGTDQIWQDGVCFGKG